MLQFSPANSITFVPNSHQHLFGTFTISNSNKYYVPFKVKSTNPELFNVTPYVGMINPKENIEIKITSVGRSSPELAKDLSQNHKFMIQYGLIEKKPENLHEGLQLIKADIRQSHKMYINTSAISSSNNDKDDNKSDISNKLSYRTSIQTGRKKKGNSDYHEMNDDQKFDHLRSQIMDLEKQKSELISKHKPSKKGLSIIKKILFFIILVILGNILGKQVGIRQVILSKPKKPEEGWFSGFKKIIPRWESQETKKSKPFWKFWS